MIETDASLETVLRDFEAHEAQWEAASDDVVLERLSGVLRPPPAAPVPEHAAADLFAPPAPQELRHIPRRGRVYRPQSVADVQALVRYGRDHDLRVRAAGASHSRAEAIGGRAQDLLMDLAGALRAVEVLAEDPAKGELLVRVGGGCRIGVDPSDPESTWANSVVAQLDARGYALPLTGGITHQSVAGFSQTGSSGGSIARGTVDALEGIELVDGDGNLVELRKGQEAFDGAAVAMGLLGVVVRLTLRLRRRFLVEGVEANVAYADSLVARRAGGHALTDALRDVEYLHLNWFPQKYARRVMQWTGTRATTDRPLVPYENTLRQTAVAALAALALRIDSGLLAIDPASDLVQRFVGFVMQRFVPLESKRFCDHWWRALPTDDQVLVDSLIKTHFTEVWLPAERTDEVLDILADLFARDPIAAGNFAVEIYGAKRTPFWLSMAYEQDVVRVDPYWWAYNHGRPEAYFTRFWDRLLDVPGARLHWGKYMPRPGQRCGASTFDRAWLRGAYPRLDDWLRLRTEMDPKQVFLTDYWRAVFEIPRA